MPVNSGGGLGTGSTVNSNNPDLTQYNSCVSGDPLIKFDENGQSSVLRYDLPVETSLDANVNILINADPSYFAPEYLLAPEDDYFKVIENLTPSAAETLIVNSLKPQAGKTLIMNAGQLRNGIKPAVKTPMDRIRELKGGRKLMEGSAAYAKPDQAAEIEIADESMSEMVAKVVQGLRPVIYKKPFGTLGVRYISRPKQATPRITMVEHYKIASFLGDYGAGKVLKTFSLYPGEKTTIAIRSFKKSEELKKRAESVLDSVSEESMNELQSTVENEANNANSSNNSSSNSSNFSAGINVGFSIPGVGSIGGSTSYSSANTETAQTQRSNAIRALTNSINKQTSQANQSRSVEVNTESSTSVTTEEENTITRSIENINKSRVLNFVYRQLLQDYFTITYLDDVTFVFENGYPEHTKTCKLSGLNALLTEVLADSTKVDEIRNNIFTQLCSVLDYQDTPTSFIEAFTHTLGNCIESTGTTTDVFVRKVKTLSQTYLGKTVDGIITDVTHRTLKTDSIIVDALLANGEALDCFNQRLQDEAARQSFLENQKTKFALDLLGSVRLENLLQSANELGGEGEGDAQVNTTYSNIEIVEKIADAYKMLFGNCCPTDIRLPNPMSINASLNMETTQTEQTNLQS